MKATLKVSLRVSSKVSYLGKNCREIHTSPSLQAHAVEMEWDASVHNTAMME